MFVMFALIAVVGISASDDLINDAASSNVTEIVQGATGATAIVQPVFILIGFVVLIIGIMVAINAYN